MSNTTRILVTALIVTSLGNNLAAQAAPAAPAASAKPTIVLVHGAFADGSSWSKVIPILQRDGYTVIAVQNPLTSFAADVETTKRVIDAQTGPSGTPTGARSSEKAPSDARHDDGVFSRRSSSRLLWLPLSR
jgi:hypothetical protein